MEKLTENITIGCDRSNYINYGPPYYNFTCAITPNYEYLRCDMGRIIDRLREYEALEMTPKEIRQALQDADELADKFVEYYNKYVDSASVAGFVGLNLDEFYEIIQKAKMYDKIVETLRYTK